MKDDEKKLRWDIDELNRIVGDEGQELEPGQGKLATLCLRADYEQCLFSFDLSEEKGMGREKVDNYHGDAELKTYVQLVPETGLASE